MYVREERGRSKSEGCDLDRRPPYRKRTDPRLRGEVRRGGWGGNYSHGRSTTNHGGRGSDSVRRRGTSNMGRLPRS